MRVNEKDASENRPCQMLLITVDEFSAILHEIRLFNEDYSLICRYREKRLHQRDFKRCISTFDAKVKTLRRKKAV